MPLDPNRILRPAKKLRRLVKKMKTRPGKVHGLRTSARRFEAALDAFDFSKKGREKSLLKRLGKLRKRAGKVRDMDVLLGYASGVHVKGEEECLAELLERLGVMRRKFAKRLSAKAKRLRPAVVKDLDRTIPKLNKITVDGEKHETARAAASTAVDIAASLSTPRRLGRNNLHAYRLKVKQLRNVLKMAARSSDRKLLDDLGEAKDAIGEWHDWQELIAIADKALEHGSACKLLPELKGIAARKYAHALALAEALRTHYLHRERPLGKGASADSRKRPSTPVLEAAASLAG